MLDIFLHNQHVGTITLQVESDLYVFTLDDEYINENNHIVLGQQLRITTTGARFDVPSLGNSRPTLQICFQREPLGR